jgi:putative membrane protein
MSDFFRLLAFLWTNRQRLLSLLEALPSVLDAAGASMEAAGAGAIEASRYIRGNGTSGLNARSAFDAGAGVIEEIRSQVDNVKVQLDLLAGFPLFIPVKPQMDQVSNRVQDVSDEIQKMADNLSDVSSALNSAGQNLKTLGQSLRSAGSELQQIS